MAEIVLYMNSKARTKLQKEIKNNAIFSDHSILKQVSIINQSDEKLINDKFVSSYRWKRINKNNITIITTIMFFIDKEDYLLQNLTENIQYGELPYPNPMGFIEYTKENFNKLSLAKQAERLKNKKPEPPAKRKEADHTADFINMIKRTEEALSDSTKEGDDYDN